MAFAFGLSAEIEREMISRRTKEALALRKAQGVHIGRIRGSKNSYNKITGKEDWIKEQLQKGIPKAQIGESDMARYWNNVAHTYRARAFALRCADAKCEKTSLSR